MSVLPRAECQICKQSVPVRRNGALREHRQFRWREKKCPGSGQFALVGEEFRPITPLLTSYYSCRITTKLTASICSTKHRDLERAREHARAIQLSMGERALMVEVVGRIGGTE